jgi:hypothetical protein
MLIWKKDVDRTRGSWRACAWKQFRIQATSKLDAAVEVDKKGKTMLPERTTDKKRVK